MMTLVKAMALTAALAVTIPAAEWSEPVHVLHELKPCVTYRARVDGEFLIIQASLQPGWHTFTVDNEQRAAEKLAGKPSIGIDQPTQIKVSNGLETAGPWHQSQPRDFSKPELRWFSWGFEDQAVFAAKMRRSQGEAAEVQIRGQACTDKVCKNVDVSLNVLVPAAFPSGAGIDLKTLVQAR
mgnify:CR=1 FL=1